MSNTIFPDIPSMNGIPTRTLMIVSVTVVSLLGLFIFFIGHYTLQQPAKREVIQRIDHSQAEEAVHRIAHQPVKPVDVEVTPAKTERAATPTVEPKSDETFLSRAGESAISAYKVELQHQSSEPENMPSQTATAIQASEAGRLTPYQLQNGQSLKESFLQHNQQGRGHGFIQSESIVLPKYTLSAGTIIPATLITGISSDLPGTIKATVSRAVFDTVTGQHCLIPQGAMLFGKYDSTVTYGQRRVLVTWQQLLLPTGESIALKGQPGVDARGLSGLHDQVDNHATKLIGNALLFSLFSGAGGLGGSVGSSSESTQAKMAQSLGQEFSQIGQQITAKNLDVQPTLIIRPGYPFNVLLTQDLVLQRQSV